MRPDAEAAQEEVEMRGHRHRILKIHERKRGGVANMEQEKERVSRTANDIPTKVESKVHRHSSVACWDSAMVL